MNKVIDLGTIVKDDLIFKMPNGDEFVIPGDLDLNYVLKLSKQQEKLEKSDSIEEQVEVLKAIVLDTLSLDRSKDIGMDYIDEHLSNITLLKVILENVVLHLAQITDDENL